MYMNGNQNGYVQQDPEQAKPAKQKTGRFKTFLSGLIGVILGGVLMTGLSYAGIGNLGSGGGATPTESEENGTITINADTVSADLPEGVAAKCLPSVVSIDVYSQASYSGLSSLDLLYYDQETEPELQVSGMGSGVIISEDGYIITNYHVVEGGADYVVHFDDDTSAQAKLIGSDSSSDIAVLKVDKEGLTPMQVGDSSNVAVGEWVMALGAPFGLTKSVSSGIVSALYRSDAMQSTYDTTFYVNMIQTDAVVNPGNSGGALVNAEGNLIGINTMISSYSGDYAGVGFAIPSNYAMDIAQQIIDNGYAKHPYVGVNLGTVDAASQQYYGVDVSAGAYVGTVVEGSPAADAGLQEGDVIVSYNGKDVATASEFIIDVRSSSIGDTVELGIVRGGKEQTVEVTLASDESISQSNASQGNQSAQGQGGQGGSDSRVDPWGGQGSPWD
ncbi:MAG: S1C family serine protease [Coriobacteriales bacterium]|jgi:S1-C subfamily serine protease